MSYKLENGENVMQEHSDEARPATSCHVWWKPNTQVDIDSEFELECTAIVSKREPCTYFALIGYHGCESGGYGGIQEDEEGKTILLFSVWDSPTNKTIAIDDHHHNDCIIRRFGGEGVGMQCLLYKKWNINQEVKQTIHGKCIARDDNSQTWHISCTFTVGNDRYRMATYKWQGPHSPLPKPEFYSFVEDWNRQPNAQGDLRCRSAKFKDAKVRSGSDWTKCSKFNFTKVENGADAFAADIVNQTCSEDGTEVLMSTGRS